MTANAAQLAEHLSLGLICYEYLLQLTVIICQP